MGIAMTIVSNFELIFKPQSPANPGGTTAVDRAIQGYFLEITDLENVELAYLLEFTIFPPPVGTPNREFRSLAGNTLCIVDTGGGDNQFGTLDGALTSDVFVPRFPMAGPTPGLSTNLVTVPPQAAALVAVLPSAFRVVNPIEPTPLTVPNFEVRGYVRIRLPALFTPPAFERQNGGNDAKVLLTPQNRATFITAADVISDQTQAGLPLATGDALNVITPDELLFFTAGPPAMRERAEGLGPLAGVVQGVPVEARSDLLQMLMGQLDADGSDLSGINESLAEAGVSLAIERRGRSR
jgi:hypothetical protein